MAVFTGNGSVSSPSFTFSSDTNTGIFRPDVDQLGLVTDGATRLFINATGQVGLGTTSPNELLEVTGNIHMSGAADRTIFNRSNNALTFGTNNSPSVTITNTGDIGIGTTSPDQKLHVDGQVYGANTPRNDIDGVFDAVNSRYNVGISGNVLIRNKRWAASGIVARVSGDQTIRVRFTVPLEQTFGPVRVLKLSFGLEHTNVGGTDFLEKHYSIGVQNNNVISPNPIFTSSGTGRTNATLTASVTAVSSNSSYFEVDMALGSGRSNPIFTVVYEITSFSML